MPPKKRRKLTRPKGTRRYNKMFVLAVEGTKTELEYFYMFRYDNPAIHIECLKSKHGASPSQVLRNMKKCLKDLELQEDDEAWLITDKDNWDDNELTVLYQWAQTKENYHFALSNPSFEYWLLLHFEDGKKISNQKKCKERLKKHIPDYDKKIDPNKFKGKFHDAVRRAKEKDKPRCKDWPRNTGTTVYRIVEKFLQ